MIKANERIVGTQARVSVTRDV